MKKFILFSTALTLLPISNSIFSQCIKEKELSHIYRDWKKEIKWKLWTNSKKVERECPVLFASLKKVMNEQQWDKESWSAWKTFFTELKLSITLHDIDERLLDMSCSSQLRLGWVLGSCNSTKKALFGLGGALKVKFEEQLQREGWL